MKFVALLLLASPIAHSALASEISVSQAIHAQVQSFQSVQRFVPGRRIFEAPAAGSQAPSSGQNVGEEEEPDAEEADPDVPATPAPPNGGFRPADRPPEAFGQFPARPDEPFDPFSADCKPFSGIPGSSTLCSAGAYQVEAQCIAVPGCRWTNQNICTGGFDPRGCADMSPDVCTRSLFCTRDDVNRPFGAPGRTAAPAPEAPPPQNPADVGGDAGGGGGDDFGRGGSRFDDDASEAMAQNGGFTGGLGVVGRDSVGPGGRAIEGDGSTGVTSLSPVPETPLTPYVPPSSANPNASCITSVMLAFATSMLVALFVSCG